MWIRKVRVRTFFLWAIVPSLLFIIGCSRHQSARTSPESSSRLEAKPKHAFTLTDIDERNTTLSLKQGQLRLSRVVQPHILLHFFSTRADLCRAMLPYLSNLQHKRNKDLFVLGIVMPEKIDTLSLRQYMHRTGTTFFVSRSPDNRALGDTIASMLKLGSNYPLPLTVLFDHGRYVTHYEGITPIEMIRSDLDELPAAPTRTKTKER